MVDGLGVGWWQEQSNERCFVGLCGGWRRRGDQEEEAVLPILLAVEAMVAAVGSTLEGVIVLRVGATLELLATVHDVPAQRRRVVAQALVVPHLGR